jgi:hypothetical protein
MTQTIKFESADRRELLDVLIEVCKTVGKGEPTPSIEVGGKTYARFDHLKVAALLPDEELQAHHQAKIDRMFQKRQHGYRRTAHNLVHRANQIGSAIRSREFTRQRMEEEAQARAEAKAMAAEAARQQAALHARTQALQEAALAAHPGWREITEPILTAGGRTFVKTEKKAPGTLNGLVKWFERTHSENANTGR